MPDYKYLDALVTFVRRARDELSPAAIILFGSLAKGDYYVHSDADVCVLLREPEVDWHAGYERAAALDDQGIVQPMVYGREQFVTMLREANALALEVGHDGWVLVGDEDVVNELEKAFSEAVQQYRLGKTAGGWRMSRHEAR
ncbi:MAG: nucleotidyltransferase domain-containing protein [Salinibacter sp.]